MAINLDMLRSRARILAAVRSFFNKEGFWEAETPLLTASPGLEPHLDAFTTRFIFESGRPGPRLYLPTSPEFHMKRLVAAGADRIFQITRAFRNGEVGGLHNPEFTILEWYRSHAGYEAIMADTERLVATVATHVLGVPTIHRDRSEISLEPPWERITVAEAFQKYADIDLLSARQAEALRAAGAAAGVPHLLPEDSWDILFFKIFLSRIEPELGWHKPVILYEYPASMAALARLKPDDPSIALRFEVYIGGVELANAFDELTDESEQRRRFETARREKLALGKPPFPVDEAFLAALREGMPPCAGIALGVDRLVMLLLEKESVQDVLAFPFGKEFASEINLEGGEIPDRVMSGDTGDQINS